MPFTLQDIVPWGRTLREYCRMFALKASDHRKRILGCADGPASFNAEMTAGGGHVISCDPLYSFSEAEIRRRIEDTYPEMIQQAVRNQDQFLWSPGIPNPSALGRHRMLAMTQFLQDYEAGKQTGRYVVGELPNLPFEASTFELALCSHLLFLYSEQLSERWHLRSAHELMRVAQEVRIFPLLGLDAEPSRHLLPVAQALTCNGFRVQIETVDYEFQRGGNQMMRVTR